MGDYWSYADDARREAAEAEYYAEMQEREMQLWLEGEISQQSKDRIRDAISEAYSGIRSDLAKRAEEIMFLRTKGYSNLVAVSALLTVEKVSRELVSLPILMAVLEGDATARLQDSKALVRLLDKQLNPAEFVLDLVKSRVPAGDGGAGGAPPFQISARPMNDGDFFLKDASADRPISSWAGSVRDFRNNLMHGRRSANEREAELVFDYAVVWFEMIEAILTTFDVKMETLLPKRT